MSTCRSIGDVGHVLEDMVRIWRSGSKKSDEKAMKSWWNQIDAWRARNSLAYKPNDDVIMPQYAIQRLYELTKHRKTFISTEVGAAFRCGRHSFTDLKNPTTG